MSRPRPERLGAIDDFPDQVRRAQRSVARPRSAADLLSVADVPSAALLADGVFGLLQLGLAGRAAHGAGHTMQASA